MAVKNFSRHMPNTSGEFKNRERNLSDRMAGAVGEGATYAALGSKFGPVGAGVGGTFGVLKGFFGTPKGGGADSLTRGAVALADARSEAAKKKMKPGGKLGKVKKDSADGFLKKGEVITRAAQEADDFEGY